MVVTTVVLTLEVITTLVVLLDPVTTLVELLELAAAAAPSNCPQGPFATTILFGVALLALKYPANKLLHTAAVAVGLYRLQLFSVAGSAVVLKDEKSHGSPVSRLCWHKTQQSYEVDVLEDRIRSVGDLSCTMLRM